MMKNDKESESVDFSKRSKMCKVVMNIISSIKGGFTSKDPFESVMEKNDPLLPKYLSTS
jgi:hypothetical protein